MVGPGGLVVGSARREARGTVWGNMGLIHYWTTRGLVIVGAVLAMVVGWAVVRVAGVPAAGVVHGSLVLQPNPAVAIGVTAVAVVLAGVVGLAVAGRVRAGAAVFCGVFVLVAISVHTQGLRAVLFAAPTAGTYVRLAVETAVLGGVIAACHALGAMAVRRGLVKSDEEQDGFGRDDVLPPAGVGETVLAVLLTAAVYVLVAWFMLPTDLKQQALLGCAVAGFGATAIVHYFVMPRAPAWGFWAGVLLGAAGAFAYASTVPGVPAVGEVAIPPARALPIDHASAGVAAAMAGYWYSRKWRQADVEAQAEAEVA